MADNDLEKLDVPGFEKNFLPSSLKSLNLNNTRMITSQLGLFLSRNPEVDFNEVYFNNNVLQNIGKSPSIVRIFSSSKKIVDVSQNAFIK